MLLRVVVLAAVATVTACGSGTGSPTIDGGGPGEPDAAGLPMTAGAERWRDVVQPLIAAECGSCHLGSRFAFASLVREGAELTEAETATNYYNFLDLLSLDAPRQSRLLAKAVGPEDVEGMTHAGGAVIARDDATWTAILSWIELEKGERCVECGMTAPRSYIAYVDQPRLFWALEPDPFRTDHGLRDRARIMLQPLTPGTLTPEGDAIDFLGDSWCGADGRCDFGNLAVSHDGTRMAFECRLTFDAADSPTEARWNVCVAEIGLDGRAVNPRFLMPEGRRHHGDDAARSDPYGLRNADGSPLKGPYDLHFQTRRRNDRTPVFTPDDEEVVLASQGVDPRTGEASYQTYHGFEALDHIVAVGVADGALRTIYRNEGGVADSPFFLRNGNVVFHTWNLERMDRHLYTQARADGMGELPVFLGRSQGPNMWGKATQLGNGAILGMTGRRRSSIENYVLFAGDHTLGLGLDGLQPIRVLDQAVFEQVLDFPEGYCDARANPDGPSCAIDRFYADPSYSPDGRALIAYSPERTYVLQGEDMFLGYASGSNIDEQLASMEPYLPRRLGIALADPRGNVTTVLEPPSDRMYRYPVWVGRRWAERDQGARTDESVAFTDLHIADVPLWFSFRDNTGDTDRSAFVASLDAIVAVRVLVKEAGGNACLNDGRPYRFSVNAGAHDHPTHLGINNATGYTRLAVPASAGGDAWGDVPVKADRSVSLRVPAGKLLLFQGIDAEGHVVRQNSRVTALPPGHAVDTSVRRDQYASQCASCHGAIGGAAYVPLAMTDQVELVGLDYATEARAAAPVDLTAAEARPATFLHAVRPVLDAKCVSCHSGPTPGGELSLEAAYSTTANFPAGKWATTPGLADGAYMASVPEAQRVPGYDYSVTWAWMMHEDETEYRTSPEYAGLIASGAPLGAMAAWDPAYQNLFANDGSRWVYLGGYFTPNFGRSDRVGGISQDAWLLEILTGEDVDPARDHGGAVDHVGMMSEAELRELMAVMDVGWVYMLRCDDRDVPSGVNAGMAWGEP